MTPQRGYSVYAEPIRVSRQARRDKISFIFLDWQSDIILVARLCLRLNEASDASTPELTI